MTDVASAGPRPVNIPTEMKDPVPDPPLPPPPPPVPPMPPQPPEPPTPRPPIVDPPIPQVGSDESPPGPDEELWSNGPTMAQIEEWKQQYGEGNIYVTSLTPDDHVVWRTLTRFEYRRLVKSMEQSIASGQVSQAEANMNNEEAITELCVLFPGYSRQTSAGVLAGLPSVISQEVMEASGFNALEVRQL